MLERACESLRYPLSESVQDLSSCEIKTNTRGLACSGDWLICNNLSMIIDCEKKSFCSFGSQIVVKFHLQSSQAEKEVVAFYGFNLEKESF